MAFRPRLWVTPLHIAEWIHAIERQVFQKHISQHEALQIYADFDRDRGLGVWIEVALSESAFEVFGDLGRRYASGESHTRYFARG
jgi:hypothetical protein